YIFQLPYHFSSFFYLLYDVGVKKGKEVVTNVVEKGKNTVKNAVDDIETKGIKEALGDVIAPQKDIDNTIMEVFQTKDARDVGKLKQVVDDMDTQNITNYKDFSKKISDDISHIAKKQDEALEKVSDTFGVNDLKTTTKDGDYEVNFVQKAVDDLERYAQNRNDIEILDTLKQFKKDEYTLKDLNNLARYYGQNFSDKAFKTNGDLKIGDIAGSYENTRAGLKNLVREKFGSPELQELDAKMSALYTAKKFTQSIEQKVQRLKNVTHDRKIGEVVVGKLDELTDFLTMGLWGGFKKKIFVNSGVGKKTMDSFDIESHLGENLARIQKLLDREKNMSNKEFLGEVNQVMKEVRKDMGRDGGMLNTLKEKAQPFVEKTAEKVGAKANFISEKEVGEYAQKLEQVAKENNIPLKINKGSNEGANVLKATSEINRNIPKNTGKKTIQAKQLYDIKYESIEKLVKGINNGTVKGSYRLGTDQVNKQVLGTIMIRVGNTSKRLHIPLEVKKNLQKIKKR
ncbi:hypothetical protein KGV52_01620, partial [Candidatus Gracilibacteria bacterium]|nr:hypothetical protein [Candidatus Gracilibacteria bacterium]